MPPTRASQPEEIAEVSAFLAQCRESSHLCYEAFKHLLDDLESAAARPHAARVLHGVAREGLTSTCETEHFRFRSLSLDRSSRPLLVLELPSVFAPERWSFTFHEGLQRLPASEWAGRTIAELGCGNGWISLALARRSPHARLIGLDVNPRAVVCARINLFLNATTENGAEIRDGDGGGLLDRVRFEVSDLLGYCRDQHLEIDRVVACIPQVLDPDLDLAHVIAPESESDEFLYSLSNYCGKQGYIEDQFGLGLVARALEESVACLSPGGKVVFNLGGRPGRAVLQRMFQRRGFSVREIWQTRVAQAADTDIDALVEIESRTPHRFEFYLDAYSDESVSARTASAFAQAGGGIFHSLYVCEAELAHPAEVRRIFEWLHEEPHRAASGALDLAFDDPGVAEEKIAFLAALAAKLSRLAHFPYEETAGARDLRRGIADFLAQYFRLAVSAEQILVTPSRLDVLHNVLALYRPSVVLVDRDLLRTAGLDIAQTRDAQVLECPRRTDLVCDLMQALRPQWVLTGLADFESVSPDSFLRLVETARETGTRLMVDLSSQFELSSTPRSLGVFKVLAQRPMPAHVALMCGLVRNRVYRELDTCFVWSADAEFLGAMTRAAELTYSRAPLLSQDYYSQIFSDLLSFRVRDANPPEPPHGDPASHAAQDFVDIDAPVRRAFEHPALKIDELDLDASVARLDYGENALPSPSFVKVALFEAFARQNFSASELDLEPALTAFLSRRLGLAMRPGGRFLCASGVSPLFSTLAEWCARSRRPLLLPRGCYGYFAASAAFHGADVHWIPSEEHDEFRAQPAALREAAARAGSGAVFFLNAPVVNPTGSLYGESEILELLQAAHAARTTVILDAVFSGLEFPGQGQAWLLEHALGADSMPEMVVLGGISKELAAGGLRFGFAFTRSEEIANLLQRAPIHRPHATLRYAARRMLEECVQPSAATREQLLKQRSLLSERAGRLCTKLSQTGWQPLKPRGGLFLVARPRAFEGRRCRWLEKDREQESTLDADQIVRALLSIGGVLINGATWTGLPGYCRFVLSVEEEVFERALVGLERFHGRVLGADR